MMYALEVINLHAGFLYQNDEDNYPLYHKVIMAFILMMENEDDDACSDQAAGSY